MPRLGEAFQIGKIDSPAKLLGGGAADSQGNGRLASPFVSGKWSSAFPAHAPATVRFSVIDFASSLTAGLSWYPAASLGKYRNKTVGRLRSDSPSSTGLRKVTQASARRWPCAERLAPNRLPDATGAAAGPEAAKERV